MKTSYKNKKRSRRTSAAEKIWMFIIPLIAFACCALILWPHISGLWNYLEKEHGEPAESAPTEALVYGASLSEREWDACGGDVRKLVLSASSFERDMTVVVRDENNNVVTGEQFDVLLTNAAGESCRYKTKTDGSCYIVELTPGNYAVALESSGAYVLPEQINCTVNAATQYRPIENISRVIDVYDVTQISPSEMKTDSGPVAQSFVPEIIFTPVEPAYIDMTEISAPTPVTDAFGHTVYDYDFHLGSNGYLLYSGTDQESDVLPVDEDGDGVYEYGIRFETASEPVFTPQTAASEGTDSAAPTGIGIETGSAALTGSGEGTENASPSEGYYTSVSLFNADNTPVALYAIDASPATQLPRTTQNGVGWQSENGKTYYLGADGQRKVGLKNIDGKLYYFNNRGEKAASLGIDVSCFNGHIDWNAVRAQGIDFAIIRLGGRGWSSGSVYEDTFVQEHMQGAKNAGIRVGVYFYSMAINAVEAVQEASVVLEKLNGTHLDLPIFIDMEYSGSYPNGRADKLPVAQRVEIARAFCQTVTSSGYSAGIYASESYMRSALDYGSLSRYSYWLANYTENNALPGFSGKYDIWQFTNGGQISGISGTVDMDVMF